MKRYVAINPEGWEVFVHYLICSVCVVAAVVVLSAFEQSKILKVLLLMGIIPAFISSAQKLLRSHSAAWVTPRHATTPEPAKEAR